MKKILYLIIISLFCSCSSIINGLYDEILVESKPEGAEVKLNNEYKGKTPLLLEIRKKENFKIEIEIEGYKSFYYSPKLEIDNFFYFNLIPLPLAPIFMTYDLISGGAYKFNTSKIKAILKKEKQWLD